VPRIGDLELSNARLALRLIGGFILGGFVLFVFYYLPYHLDSLASPFVPSEYMPYVREFVSSLVSSGGLPLLGVLLAVMVFFDILLAGSWIYGIDLIITGVLFLAYDILLFRAGQFFVTSYPNNVTQSPVYQEMTPILEAIIVILVISTIYSIGRGAYLVARRNRTRRLR
jgi:hypothetical protein